MSYLDTSPMHTQNSFISRTALGFFQLPLSSKNVWAENRPVRVETAYCFTLQIQRQFFDTLSTD